MTEFTPILTTPERIDADFPSAPLLTEDLDEYGVVTDSRVAMLRVGPVEEMVTRLDATAVVVTLHGLARHLYALDGRLFCQAYPDNPRNIHAYLPVLKCFHAQLTEVRAIRFGDVQPGMILCGQPRVTSVDEAAPERIFFGALDCCVVGWDPSFGLSIHLGSEVIGTTHSDPDDIAHVLVEQDMSFILK